MFAKMAKSVIEVCQIRAKSVIDLSQIKPVSVTQMSLCYRTGLSKLHLTSATSQLLHGYYSTSRGSNIGEIHGSGVCLLHVVEQCLCCLMLFTTQTLIHVYRISLSIVYIAQEMGKLAVRHGKGQAVKHLIGQKPFFAQF